MRILLDHCVPHPIRNHLPGHEVATAYERGWATLKNGALLSAAEAHGIAVLVTTDQNLPYQQVVAGRQIAVLILIARTNRVPDLLPLIPAPFQP